MKWFKHFTDNHRGRSIQNLMDEMGHTGLCYFLLMEICAEKLCKFSDKTLEEPDCLFRFSSRVVRQNLRVSPAKLEVLLGFCQANGLLSYQFFGKELEIKMPILLDLLDYDSKKSRPVRAAVAPRSRLDTETESDTETETETESYIPKVQTVKPKVPKKMAPPADGKAAALVAHYCLNFKNRHDVNPSISRTDAGILKNLFGQMGIDRAKILIEAYFTMPDAYVQKAKHPIKLLSYRINEVLVFAETGNFVTNSQVRQTDVVAGNLLVLQQMNGREQKNVFD